MDELRRHAAPLVERWQRFPRGQRVAVIAAVIASVLGFSLLIGRGTAEWQPICGGREFSANELSAIQTAWREHGLKTFRRDGHSLAVPKAEAARYEAALPKLKSSNADAGSEWEKQLARTNFFTTSEQLEQHKDNALRNELRRILKAIPWIADVDVIWTRSKPRSTFAGRSKVTATINVLPRDGHDLTPELAQSLRTAVAHMVSDLSEADIAVLDQSTGLTMTDSSGQIVTAQQLRRQQERRTQQIETKILTALKHIPGTLVEVEWTPAESNVTKNVAPENLKHITAKPVFGRSVLDWHNDTPGNFIELTTFTDDETSIASPPAAEPNNPSACQIAVRIPQAYFDAHFARQWLGQQHQRDSRDTASSSFEQLCAAECSRLRNLLRSVLPTDVSATAVTVVADHDSTPTAAPTETTAGLFTAWPHVTGTSIAFLCIVAAWRSRSRRQLPVATTSTRETASDNPPTAGEVVAALAPSASADEPSVSTSVIPITSEPRMLDDLARLQQLAPERLADALRFERPQAIAVLLTRFPTRLASACLSRLSSSAQTDVIRRLKSLGDVPEDLVKEIASAVCLRLSPPSEEPALHPTNRIAHLLPESSTPRVFA